MNQEKFKSILSELLKSYFIFEIYYSKEERNGGKTKKSNLDSILRLLKVLSFYDTAKFNIIKFRNDKEIIYLDLVHELITYYSANLFPPRVNEMKNSSLGTYCVNLKLGFAREFNDKDHNLLLNLMTNYKGVLDLMNEVRTLSEKINLHYLQAYLIDIEYKMIDVIENK